MKPRGSSVEERARAAVEAFAAGLEEARVLEEIQDAYAAALEQLPEPNVHPEVLDRRPVLFELVCYGTHLMLSMAEAKLAPRRNWFGLAKSDGRAEPFKYALLESLQRFIVSQGLEVREAVLVKVGPPARFGWGERVNPLRRSQQYAACSSEANAFDLFCRILAGAIDRERYPVTTIIAGHIAPIVARIAQGALSFVLTATEDEIEKTLAEVRRETTLDGEREGGRCRLLDAERLDLRSGEDLPLERLEILFADDDHFSLSVERCVECGQLFMRCFVEIVLYQVGRDDECWVYFLPVTANEMAKVKSEPRSALGLFATRHSLVWPPDGQAYWSRGIPWTATMPGSPAPAWFRGAL